MLHVFFIILHKMAHHNNKKIIVGDIIMLQDTKIDVLIPSYNCENYIKQCLNSLLSQSYKNINIIIADDGSTDKTFNILNEYQQTHTNIIVFKKTHEHNISKTRNFLLNKIKSDYFTFFDADDYAESTYIEELFSNLTAYDADISMCQKKRHHEKNHRILSNKNPKTLYFFNQKEALKQMLSSKLYNGTVYCKLFKTSILKESKFDENIHYGEDLDFCFKVMQNANRFIYSNKKLYHYIIRKNSIVTSKFNTKKLTCINCYDNIINKTTSNTLLICAKSMKGLIATELLYYIWRDHYENKEIKKSLKLIIKQNLPFIKQNKNLPIILRLSPLILWITQLM